MKRFFCLLALLLAICTAQAADITSIAGALKSGNSNALSGSMDSTVDLAVPGETKKCNGPEAVTALGAFFQRTKPTGFSVVHHVEKKDNGFFIGKMQTAGGELRVNIAYRTDGNKALIQSIRIE